MAKGTIIECDRTGLLLVPAQADYVVWTRRTAYFANRPDLAASKRSIWAIGENVAAGEQELRIPWLDHQRK